MRAALYEGFGSAADVLEIGEVERPRPDGGEVLVRVRVSGANPVDRRQGGRGEMEAPRVIPHFDGAGTVEAVGPGVDPGRVGQRVWIFEGQWGSPFGTAAEYVVVPETRAVSLPPQATFEEGACLGIPALTAYGCVFSDGAVKEKTVLVTGGAGAVGRYAIQFAKLSGARVLATVSSGAKGEIAAKAGADVVVDYKRDLVDERVLEATAGAGVDHIVEVELGGNLETSLAVLKEGGTIAAYASQAVPEPSLPFYALLYKSVSLRHVLVFQLSEETKMRAAADLDRWMTGDKLSHHIGERFPLHEIIAAHEAVEKGALGKILVSID